MLNLVKINIAITRAKINNQEILVRKPNDLMLGRCLVFGYLEPQGLLSSAAHRLSTSPALSRSILVSL